MSIEDIQRRRSGTRIVQERQLPLYAPLLVKFGRRAAAALAREYGARITTAAELRALLHRKGRDGASTALLAVPGLGTRTVEPILRWAFPEAERRARPHKYSAAGDRCAQQPG
jgi:hypothetical protein